MFPQGVLSELLSVPAGCIAYDSYQVGSVSVMDFDGCCTVFFRIVCGYKLVARISGFYDF